MLPARETAYTRSQETPASVHIRRISASSAPLAHSASASTPLFSAQSALEITSPPYWAWGLRIPSATGTLRPFTWIR